MYGRDILNSLCAEVQGVNCSGRICARAVEHVSAAGRQVTVRAVCRRLEDAAAAGLYLNEHRDHGGARRVVATVQGKLRADGKVRYFVSCLFTHTSSQWGCQMLQPGVCFGTDQVRPRLQEYGKSLWGR